MAFRGSVVACGTFFYRHVAPLEQRGNLLDRSEVSSRQRRDMSIDIGMSKTQHSSGVLCLRGLGEAAKIFTHPILP